MGARASTEEPVKLTPAIHSYPPTCPTGLPASPTYLPTHLSYQPYLPTYLPTYLSTYRPTYLSTYQLYLPTYLLVYLAALPTYLPTCLPTSLTNLPTCLPTYLPAYQPCPPLPPPDQLPADPPTSGSEELVYPRPHLLPPSSHTCRVPRGTLWPECLCMQGKESACRPSIFGVQKFPPNIISRPDLHRPRNRVGGFFGVAPHPLCFFLSFVAEDAY